MLDLLVVFAAIGVTLLFLAVVERMVSRPPRVRETPRTPGALPNYPRRREYHGDETRYPEDPPSEPVPLSALRAPPNDALSAVYPTNNTRYGLFGQVEAARYDMPVPETPPWPAPGGVPVLKETVYDRDTYQSAPSPHSDTGYDSSPSFGGGESGGGGAGSSYDSGSSGGSSYDSGSSSCDSGSSSCDSGSSGGSCE